MKLFFFDLETTGVNFWQHGIHQISGCIEIDGEVREMFDFHVAPNPDAKIDQEALDIGGVTIEQIIEVVKKVRMAAAMMTIS